MTPRTRLQPLAISLPEAFKLSDLSHGKGYELVRTGRFARVRYIDGRSVVLLRDLERWLQQLPTVRTHRRGGFQVQPPAPAAQKR